MSEPQTERMAVHCSACNARLAVPTTASGKKVKCPKCAQTFVIRPPAPLPEPEGFSMLNDLVDDAKTASPVERPQPAAMPAMPRPAAAGGPRAKSSAAGGATTLAGTLARGAGKFMLGCILSFVGAMIGAGVWCGIAVGANVELGYVAWGLGVLAGLGMYLGYREKNAKGGFAAACIAFLGVVGAKAFIFSYLVYGAITGDTGNVELQRIYVSTIRATEIIGEQGVTDPSSAEFDAKWEQAYVQAQRETERLSDQQVKQRWSEYKTMERAGEGVFAQADDSAGPGENSGTREGSGDASEFSQASEDGGEAAAALGSAFVEFLKDSFGLFDLLFVFLALGSAYKLGSGTFGAN